MPDIQVKNGQKVKDHFLTITIKSLWIASGWLLGQSIDYAHYFPCLKGSQTFKPACRGRCCTGTGYGRGQEDILSATGLQSCSLVLWHLTSGFVCWPPCTLHNTPCSFMLQVASYTVFLSYICPPWLLEVFKPHCCSAGSLS